MQSTARDMWRRTMRRSVWLLCWVMCLVRLAGCGFPRPADVGGDVPGDAGHDADAGGVPHCDRIGYPSLPWPATGPSGSVAVADVNNDGKLDLIVTHQSSLSVLLGNGDGTYRSKVDYPLELIP